MSQTSYTQDPLPAVEGMLADVSLARDIVTGIADADLAFGRFVFRAAAGATDDRPPRVAVPTATGEVTGPLGIGFAINEITLDQPTTPVGYLADTTVRILRRGRLWMVTEDAVTGYGDPVFVRFAAGAGGTILGGVRTDADTASAVALPGASFRSLAGAGELVIVEYFAQN